jgi:hypothetical protein
MLTYAWFCYQASSPVASTQVDTVTVTVDDNGHSGAGGPKAASFAIRIQV